MRVIPSNQVVMAPMRCAVAPTLGQTSGHRFIDTGQDILSSPNVPQRVYVSEPAVREMARALGWTAPDDVSRLEARLTELEGAAAAREASLAALQAQIDAVHTLRQAGFEAARKPGRPKKAAA